MTRQLIVSVLVVWLAAGVLAWVLPPQFTVQPALAEDAAQIATELGIFALMASTLGVLVLVGLAIIWREPRRAVGRVVLLISGLMTMIEGLFLLNGGALQSPEVHWNIGPAAIGAGVVWCSLRRACWHR
jgi:hypothetical protein